MKSLTNLIKEAVSETNNMFWIHMVAKVLLPGRKRRTGIECYNLSKINENATMLDFDDQIIFKYYCFYKWGVDYPKYPGLHHSWVPVASFDYDTVKKNKWEFYFDDVDCVDTKSSKDIPDVRCDGKQTANELFDKLVEYFKLNEK